MKLSQRGIDLIKQFEGYSSKAYPDPATGGAPWTIGYGTTKGVKPGMIITAEQAEKMLRDDVA
ncbi:lysozyme, partial [Escherichia coli]|uniref:lysozyme n=3 Tax=root TaxID=1 RepID=UPI001F3DC061